MIPLKWALVASGGLGVMVTTAGIGMLVAPGLSAQGFGLAPEQANPLWQTLTGAREVAMGLLLLVLVFTKQLRPLAYFMSLLVIIPITDYLVTWHPQHAVGAVLMLVLAISLRRGVKVAVD